MNVLITQNKPLFKAMQKRIDNFSGTKTELRKIQNLSKKIKKIVIKL